MKTDECYQYDVRKGVIAGCSMLLTLSRCKSQLDLELGMISEGQLIARRLGGRRLWYHDGEEYGCSILRVLSWWMSDGWVDGMNRVWRG